MDKDPPSITDAIETLRKSIELLKVTTRKDNGRSKYPYYNERYGTEVMDAVELVLRTGAPMLWPNQGCTLNTQYLRFRQGAQFAVEVLDKDFQSKLDSIKIERIPKLGLKISPKESSLIRLYPMPENWRVEFETFIDESNPGDQFERVIPLSDDDVSYVHQALFDVKALFIYEVTKTKILVIRYDRSPVQSSKVVEETAGQPEDGVAGDPE